MRRLHLIRHAATQPTLGVAGPDWPLTLQGQAQAKTFAEQLPDLSISRVHTSTEGKAVATGQATAEHVALPLETRPGPEEHRRLSVSASTLADFQAGMQHLFAHPDLRVSGDESADATRIRFTTALDSLMREQAGDALVVSHETVISLLVAHDNGFDAPMFWRHLVVPDHLVLEWPSYRLLDHASPANE